MASEKLAIELHTLQNEYPTAQHFVIAHSHGGNIVWYALRDNPELQGRINGIVCLSTPFLYLERRKLSQTLVRLLVALPLSAVIIGAMKTFSIFPELFPKIDFNGYTDLWQYSTIVKLIGFAIPTSVISYVGSVWIVRWLEGITAKAETSMKITAELMTPFLIVRTAADEASAALIICQIGSWLMNKVIAMFVLPVAAIDRLRHKYVAMKWLLRVPTMLIGLIGIYTIYTLITLPPSSTKIWDNNDRAILTYSLYSIYSIIGFIGSLPLVFPSLITFMMVLIIWPLVLVAYAVSALMMTFILGLKVAMCHGFVSVVVEPSPPGTHTICQFGLRGGFQERIKVTLNHSIAYEAPNVIIAVTNWVKGVGRDVESDLKIV